MKNFFRIRRAEEKDIPKVLDLLSQVLEIHAKIRPDLFISGTTKYSPDEVKTIFQDEDRPVYVAVDEFDTVLGYAFCAIQNKSLSNNLVPHRSFFIDDLCVDEKARGQKIGESLFRHAVKEAKRLECYDVTLNVWEGNDRARSFYEKMGMCPKETQMELIMPKSN